MMTLCHTTAIRPLTVEELPLCVAHGLAFYNARQLGGTFDPARFVTFWERLYAADMGVILGSWEGDTVRGGLGGAVFEGPYDGRRQAQELFWWMPHGGFAAVRLIRSFETWATDRGALDVQLAHFDDTPRVGRLYEKLGYPLAEYHYRKRL